MNRPSSPHSRAPESTPTAEARTLGRTTPEFGSLFLFSIDLEDIRSLVHNGHQYMDRVRTNVERVAELLARYDKRCSFFCTGDVARRHPGLVRELVAAGHEIACHSSDHIPLDRHTPESFRDDIVRCLDDFAAAGVEQCVGFRAPIGSLIAQTRWAYEVLLEQGFLYSSSVLPAPSPLYGWPDFGRDVPQKVDGLWEIPSCVAPLPHFRIPFAGGVYFRVVPFALTRALFKQRFASGYPVAGYVHPYDFDADQERFMHPEINENRLYNWLLYANRRRCLSRVEKFLEMGCEIIPYREYVERGLERADGGNAARV